MSPSALRSKLRRNKVAPRHFTLSSLLLLSTTVFILSIYYATTLKGPSAHVVTYHNSTSTAASNDTTIHNLRRSPLDDSIYIRAVPALEYNPRGSLGGHGNMTSDESDGLFFYTATLPFLSMVYAIVEGALSFFHPATLAGTGAQFASLIFSILLTWAWIINNAFWIHCDIATAPTAVAALKVCPKQVQRHLAHANRHVGIAKTALAWAVVAVLLMHAGFVVLKLVDTKRKERLLGGRTGRMGRELEPEEKSEFSIEVIGAPNEEKEV